jgi:hypothetical protein
MPMVESTPGKLVLMSGSTSLTLDKNAGKAILQRKLLFWKLKPIEAPLTDIAAVSIDKAVDRSSGVEVYNTMLVSRTDTAWALPAKDQTEAESDASALRAFLGLSP